MRRIASHLRVAVALAAAFAVAAVAAPTAASATHPIVAIRFAADSGDSCRYGSTEGYLSWRGYHTALPSGVDVSGKLVDRPATATSTGCRDDGYYSVANFDAYYGRTIVDKRSVRANNGVAEFGFALGVNSRVTSLVIQVCRNPLFGTGPSYCGAAKTYTAPANY